jgi:hypothetical protein
MTWLSRSVSVTLIDDATGNAFATSNMPVSDLPDSFQIGTILQLGEANWFVVGAEPPLKVVFTKTGQINVRLRKIETMNPNSIAFSQLDITDCFDDNKTLGVGDWIDTIPLNTRIPDAASSGLPSIDADCEEVYRIACAMSELRESIPTPDDGVYCPVCHIANIDLGKLRTACPKCGRGLLKFGWT